MANKVINGYTANENISARVVCSSVAYPDGNYSLVTVQGQCSRINTGYTTSGYGTFYLKVNGEEREYSNYYEIEYDSKTPMISWTDIKVPHDADGSKTVYIEFWGSMPDTSLTSVTCGGYFELDTIPRESSVSVDKATAKAGDTIAITLSRAASSYLHDITLTLGGRSETLNDVAEIATWVIPKEWQDQFPSASSSTLTISAVTKSGTTAIGTTSTRVKVTPSDDAAPDVLARAEGVDLFWGLFIQGKSKANIILTVVPKYGAGLVRYRITGGGYSGYTNPYTTGVLNKAGKITFTCTVTDSRGMVGTSEVTINVEEYFSPRITKPETYRCDAAGNASEDGSYIRAYAVPVVASCGGNNEYSATARYKLQGGRYSEYESIVDGPAIFGGELIGNEFYVVEIEVSDSFGSVRKEYLIEPASVRSVWGTEAAGVLRYPPSGGKGLYVTELEASGLISAKNGMAEHPQYMIIETTGALSTNLSYLYEHMENRSRMNVYVYIAVNDEDLAGGVWLVDVMRYTDEYGCMMAYKYGKTGVVVRANSLFEGRWIGWNKPVFE